MFDMLKKYMSSFTKPVSQSAGALAKDALYAGVKIGRAADSAFGLSDAISKAAFNKFGPASQRTINATDRIASNSITKAGVNWGTSGGPLTKAGRVGWQIGTMVDQKLHISDWAARKAPLISKGVPKTSANLFKRLSPGPFQRNLRPTVPVRPVATARIRTAPKQIQRVTQRVVKPIKPVVSHRLSAPIVRPRPVFRGGRR